MYYSVILLVLVCIASIRVCLFHRVLFIIRVVLIDIAMAGTYCSLYVFSYRVSVGLTGGAVIGVNDTTRVCLSFW